MRSFKTFCSIVEHHGFYLRRPSLQVSTIIDARQILSSICYHGCRYARRSCLQFSNSAETSSSKIKNQASLRALPAFHVFPIFVSYLSHLALHHLSSFHACESRCVARKMRLKTYCANKNALIPLKFRNLITCLLSAQIYQFTVLLVYGQVCKYTKFTVLRSETGTLRS